MKWLRSTSRLAVLAPVGVLAILAVLHDPAGYSAACAPLPGDEATIRARDREVGTGMAMWTADDASSYVAFARDPFGEGYLGRRSPYAYRILAPAIVFGLSRLGVPVCAGFYWLTLICLAAAGLGVFFLASATGLDPSEAAIAAALFLCIPKLQNPLFAVIVDAGAWALVAWIAWAWLRRPALVPPLLLAGLLWRETVALLSICLVLDAWDSGRRRRALAVAGLTAAGLALPRLLVSASNVAPPTLVVEWLTRAAARWVTPRGLVELAGEFLLGLGIGGFVLAANPRLLGDRLGWLGALVPLTCLAALPLEVGRLVVPAGLVLSVAAPWALRGTRISPYMFVGLAFASALAYALSLRAFWVTGTALVVAAGLLRWPWRGLDRAGREA